MSDHSNNIIVTGAVMALLQSGMGTLTSLVGVTNVEGQPTNQLDITLSFMASPYRITVERLGSEMQTVTDGD